MNARIVDKVARFPDGPGVYIFSDAAGKTLYVGKAARLRTRVRSYLRPGGDGRLAIRFLEDRATDVEFLATSTEQEALLLENTVIKKRKPVFNVRLKDDKAFLMLRLDTSEAWPWFRWVRRRGRDRARYFGPYASAKSVRRTLRLLHKVIPLRDCSDAVFHNRSRPCLKHQIGRCPAPCVGLVTHQEYDALLEQAVEVLEGRVEPLLRGLRTSMDRAAERLEFERAQALKLQIEALCRVAERQSVVGGGSADVDALGVHRVGDDVCAVFLLFRDGLLENSRRFSFRSELPAELLLAELLGRFYEGDCYVPREVLVGDAVAEVELVETWLSAKRGAKVAVLQPQRGAKRRQLEMAMQNARLADALEADAAARRGNEQTALRDVLDLEALPRRIHCLDVSTIQGTSTVASRVCLVDGQPDKGGYRRFKISAEHAGDDFSAMQEAVRRSVTRCLTDERDDVPDLLLIDGGRGQLRAAGQALAELGIGDELRLAALAKSRLRGVGDGRRATAERLFSPGQEEPVSLRAGAPEALLVARARDEAHRFAVSYHRTLRGKLVSALDKIEGVGPSRRRALLRHFGSLTAVRAASLDELAAVPSLPRRIAERVYASLARDPQG